jgi:5-formyltetrahydrofolate cyclo-ligase
MKTKNQIRKKFLILRKKKHFDVSVKKFNKLIAFLNKKRKKKKFFSIALYYPSNYEINILKIVNSLKRHNTKFLLPKIYDSSLLKFFEWNESDVLIVNKFGIPEPSDKQKCYSPDIILVPLLAFDNSKNRLGYGKGFYDRYLNRLKKLNKKIEAIGIAFSFQKYKKLPLSNYDFQLNNIFTEKGFLK